MVGMSTVATATVAAAITDGRAMDPVVASEASAMIAERTRARDMDEGKETDGKE